MTVDGWRLAVLGARLYALSLQIVSVLIVQRREARNFFEHRPESLGVGITYIVHHFIHILPARFKMLFCRFDLYPLDIFHRRIISGFFKASFKMPSANGKPDSKFPDG